MEDGIVHRLLRENRTSGAPSGTSDATDRGENDPPEPPTSGTQGNVWTRRRWRIERTRIRVDHVMASSAIPVFFPPVHIGGAYFGDGSVRNTAPLSAAINLGADRIVAVGVSGPSPVAPRRRRPAPTIGQVAGVLLGAVMLDAIEVDVEHGERVNTSVLRCLTEGAGPGSFRLVEVLWLRPSRRVRASSRSSRAACPACYAI